MADVMLNEAKKPYDNLNILQGVPRRSKAA
jgi:hypothetical protein